MDYYNLTQDQLWDQLRKVEDPIERESIIEVFKEVWGYNPDNLCITSDFNKDQSQDDDNWDLTV